MILVSATRGLCHLVINTSALNQLASTCIFVVVYDLLHVFMSLFMISYMFLKSFIFSLS